MQSPHLDVLNRSSQSAAIRIATGSQRFEIARFESQVQKLGPDPLQKCVEDFCCINFGGFCRGFSWRIFLGTFSHKNEEKKIRRENPRKNPAAQK